MWREKGRRLTGVKNLGGLSPAQAGNRIHGVGYLMQSAVYPRSRGEQIWRQSRSGCRSGLSPLARGTADIVGDLLFRGRFIPARAGNRRLTGARPERGAVYPRSRGEQAVPRPLPGDIHGLSPLARGTVSDTFFLLACRRFIPARAGNRL